MCTAAGPRLYSIHPSTTSWSAKSAHIPSATKLSLTNDRTSANCSALDSSTGRATSISRASWASLDFLYGVPERGAVLKLRRGVGREHDFFMDDAGLVRVVVGLAVPLICQFLAAPVGGGSDSRTAYAPLDDLNGTVKNRYVVFLLPPQSTAVG